ncbi:MAG: TonB family protein [Acidobacteriaceae bacterium]|nr:TonB family protein [Acidobacteriaceae bacterium]
MRKVILAALALSPMMLNAQANSPAQTKVSPATSMQSKLVALEKLGSSSSDAAAASVKPLRISTGVIAPKLIKSVNVEATSAALLTAPGVNPIVIVSMVVDKTGTPQDLKIVRSVGNNLDRNVLAAVSQYRFAPGTLNNEATPIELNLEITLQKGF